MSIDLSENPVSNTSNYKELMFESFPELQVTDLFKVFRSLTDSIRKAMKCSLTTMMMLSTVRKKEILEHLMLSKEKKISRTTAMKMSMVKRMARMSQTRKVKTLVTLERERMVSYKTV